jgi:hypothetical protein
MTAGSSTRPGAIRVALALVLVLSLAAGGAVQQAIMIADEASGTASALLPLTPVIMLVTATFAVVIWRRGTGSAVGWTAVAMLGFMLVFGVAVYALGVNSVSPGVGGNILYLMALLVVFYFLIPAAVAVPIHWLLLRGVATGR